MRRARHREAMFKLSQVLVLLPHTISFRGGFGPEPVMGFPESGVLAQKDKIDGDMSPTPYSCACTHTYTPTAIYMYTHLPVCSNSSPKSREYRESYKIRSIKQFQFLHVRGIRWLELTFRCPVATFLLFFQKGKQRSWGCL